MKKKLLVGSLLLMGLGFNSYHNMKLKKEQKKLNSKQDIILKKQGSLIEIVKDLDKDFNDLKSDFIANTYVIDEHIGVVDEQIATISELIRLHTEHLGSLIDDNRDEIITLYDHLEESIKANESEE